MDMEDGLNYGILERISDAFLALDTEWRVTYLNEKAAQIFGRSRADLVGKQLWAEMPEGVGKAFYTAYHQALAEQTPLHFEEYSTTRRRWFENYIYPSPDGLSIFFRDVTERRETQRRREENEQRFRSLYEQNPDAVYTFDLEGRFIAVNPACGTASGYTHQELLEMPCFLDVIASEDKTNAWERFEAAKAGKPQHGEISIIHKSGRRIVLHFAKIPIIVGGEVVGVYGIGKNVTEQRETQRRLEESEQRFRSLYDHHPDGVYTFDLEGRFQSANNACEAVLGYRIDELIGMSFLEIVVPEGRAAAWAHFLAARAGKPQAGDVVVLHKSGRRIALHTTKIPIVVGGEVVGVYGITKDITERKQMEEALRESEQWWRAIAETSPVAMTITRWEDGAFLYANRHFHDLFGLPPDEEVQGNAGKLLVDPADRALLLRALSAENPLRNWESHLKRPDGSQFWASGALQRIVFQGADAIFSAYHDVTERKRLLQQAQEEAERDPLTGLLNHRAFHKRFEEEARRALEGGQSLAVAVLDLDNFKFFNDSYGHTTGDDVLRQVAGALRETCRANDSLARFGGDEFALLLPDIGAETTADEIAARLEAGLRRLSYHPPEYGSDIPVSLSVGVALFPADAPNRSAVIQLADERLLRAKTGGLSGGESQQLRAVMQAVPGFSMLDALVNAVDTKDRYTRRHSEEVMVYSLLIARELALDDGTQHTVAVAALLHDVGKIGVPDSILRKPGALTEVEFEAVKQHSIMGVVIVSAVPDLKETLDCVRSHHERWDGGGYPDGLRGDQIPRLARLMAVADAYSALISDRPYRKGKTPAQAQAILEAGASSQWDPACVAAFLRALHTRGHHAGGV